MKNSEETAKMSGPKAFRDEGVPCSLRVRHYLDGIPNVRLDKVTRTQQLMASGHWPPAGDALVDRLLYEHLLGPFQS